MESLVKAKRSLKVPIRRLAGCVTGAGERKLRAKSRNRKYGGPRARGGGGRPGRGATPPPRAARSRDAPMLRSYQADLEKERKLRETMNAQKNAERAAMRAHFRRKYKLAEDPKDAGRLSAAGGKVPLPRQLTQIIRPDAERKDGAFDLLGAFQGLGLGAAAATAGGGRRSRTPHVGHSCKVM